MSLGALVKMKMKKNIYSIYRENHEEFELVGAGECDTCNILSGFRLGDHCAVHLSASPCRTSPFPSGTPGLRAEPLVRRNRRVLRELLHRWDICK